jgi:hypothetical protein
MTRRFIAVFSLLVASFSLASCDMASFYSEAETTEPVDLYYNSRSKIAFAGGFRWSGGAEGTSYSLPDQVQGYPLMRLGGYFGRGVSDAFTVIFENYAGPSPSSVTTDNFCTLEKSLLPKGAEIHFVPFVFSLGASLKEISNVHRLYNVVRQSNWNLFVYSFTASFVVSEDNATFYSQNGIIYNKSSHSVVLDLTSTD